MRKKQPRAPSLAPRKEACQERSRFTVDVLIEATGRVLVREGFDRATTGRIAQEAGVSIGTLYQYFPSKEALVAAVMERHKQDLMQAMRQVVAETEARSIDEGARRLVTMMIDAHRVDPRLHRVLVEDIPRTGRLNGIESFDRSSFAVARTYLARHAGELRAVDLELAAFICVSAVEAVTHRAVVHNPELLMDERADRFIDEVTHLVLAYLR